METKVQNVNYQLYYLKGINLYMCIDGRSICFYDCNCILGRIAHGNPHGIWAKDDLLGEMDRVGINKALVTHSLAYEYDPMVGNYELINNIADNERFEPCWVAMPHHTGEFPEPDTLLYRMKEANVKAVRILLSDHNILLNELSLAGLFSTLQSARIPVFLDYGKRHWADERMDWHGIIWACSAYPELPLVLCNVGININLKLFPILEEFSNFYIDLSYFQVHRGIEEISKKYGPHHMLFGTSMPVYEAGPAITMITYSGLGGNEKNMVAGGNLVGLLEGVSYNGK